MIASQFVLVVLLVLTMMCFGYLIGWLVAVLYVL